jgi:hypothetical protein
VKRRYRDRLVGDPGQKEAAWTAIAVAIEELGDQDWAADERAVIGAEVEVAEAKAAVAKAEAEVAKAEASGSDGKSMKFRRGSTRITNKKALRE